MFQKKNLSKSIPQFFKYLELLEDYMLIYKIEKVLYLLVIFCKKTPLWSPYVKYSQKWQIETYLGVNAVG